MGGRPDNVRFGLALVAAACGCGSGDLGPMSGQQLLAGRDFANLGFWNGRTLEFTRDAADPASTEPHDLWEWPLDETAPTVALTGIDWNPVEPWPSMRVRPLLATGPLLERVYDVSSRRADDLFRHFSGGAPEGAPPGAYIGSRYVHTAMRSDGGAIARVRWDGRDEILVGRPDGFRVFSIPGGGSVHDIAFLGADLAVLLRQTSADGDLVGIHRLDTSSGALTPLVAPVPAVQWFGDAGYCEPSLICGSFGTLGCSLDEAACASGGPPPCLVYYAKVDPDRPSRMAAYVYDVNAATASMLSGPAPDRLFVEARRVRALVWGATGFARTLDICSGVERECPLSPGQAVVWRPDGRAFVTFGRGSSTGVMNVADGTCSVPLAGEADAVAYAPDSAHLSLVVDDPGAMTQTMWLADGDGQSPIAVARGTWLRGRFSPDSRLLYVTHYDSTTGLGWVDVAAPETPERILASNAGTIGVRGNRRALFVDHYNGQDGTGDLVLVDLSTGAQQLLARAVTGVAARGSTSEVDEEGTDVAYSVRGRASSARDGLWLMTLPP